MRRALILVALLGGCGCDEPSLVPVPVEPAPVATAPVATAPVEPAPVAPTAPALPRVARDDLPPALPSVTIEVTAGGYRVTNRALVETWPAPERAEAAAHAPPGEPDFPIVELDVPVADPVPLRVPALGDAVGRLAAADLARASAAGGPRVFAVRASTDVRWERIVGALYTAAQSGYAEPWLVVQSAAGERVLQLTVGGAPLDASMRAAVAAALATLEGLGPEVVLPADPAAVLDEAEAAQADLFVGVEEDGLRLRRPELGALGADCRTADASGAPTLPRSGGAAALGTCLDAAAPFALAIVEARPDLAYGAVVPVIEALVGRAPVAIGIGSVPETHR